MDGEPAYAVAKGGPVLQGEQAYRYRLKASTFMGWENVEQFIQEFSDVVDITQWPPRVALIQLWMALTEQAKPYGSGVSVEGNVAALRARFGISGVDARTRLQGLRRNPRTPLQEHAVMVKRLAQIAYSDLPPVHQERYTYDAFVQSLNYLGLHHQFLARGVTTLKNALHEGEAYLLANQPHKGHMSSQQIIANPSEDYSEQLLPTHIAATTASSPMDVVVVCMTEMVEKLVAVLARSSTAGPVQRSPRSRTKPPRQPAMCWECGNQ